MIQYDTVQIQSLTKFQVAGAAECNERTMEKSAALELTTVWHSPKIYLSGMKHNATDARSALQSSA